MKVDVNNPLAGEQVRVTHRSLLRTFRDFSLIARDGRLCTNAECLRGAAAFLRHELLPFASVEENTLDPGSDRHECASFEHAFLASEIDAFGRAIATLLALPTHPSAERAIAEARVIRLVHRIEATLELHVQKAEE